VSIDRLALVAMLVAVILAATTAAPFWSVTVPEIVAVVV
jgi:hypothetical protein